MSQFQELLDELTAQQEEQSTLAKSLPAAEAEDDKAIQAAAEEDEDLIDDEAVDEELEGEELLGKSMMTIDGEEVEVVDADALVKSLHSLTGRVSAQEETLTKALTTTLGMVKQQGEMIKSLSARLDKVSKQGAGRKTVLTVHEKPAAGEQLAKSQPDQLTAGTVLAKAQAAYGEGKINGLEFTTIDVSLRQNEKIEPGLLAKALS